MKRIHKIILCFTLLLVLLCTVVFSASASYVESANPKETILRSIVETNSSDDGAFFYYDYGVVNFEENDFSGQPIYFTERDETYTNSLGYDSYIRTTLYLIETEGLELYYDLDSYITAELTDYAEQIDYYTHAVEFYMNDFSIGANGFAMDTLNCYVYPDDDVVDACYFTGRLRFPYGEIYEEYTPEGDFYVGSSGLQFVDFEFFPYQSDQFAQPFVEVGKTVFVDFVTGGYYEYDSVPFPTACQYYFRDVLGISQSEYNLFSDALDLVNGCYRMEFGGGIHRFTTSMGITMSYLNTVQYNYSGDSFRVPMFPQDVQVEPFEWLLQAGQTALDFELLPNITVGHLLLVILAIPILIAVLRLIAGG